MSRTINPLAALLDAQVDAHHAGVSDADITVLQQIGEEVAVFAQAMADKLARTSDARMVTRWAGHGERRETKTFSAEDLAEAIAEGALGELDAFAVVRTAVALRLHGPAPIERAAA